MGDLPPSSESSVGEFLGSVKADRAQAEPYTALSDDQSIRMLILEPGELTDLLKGRLEIVNIDSAGSYEALSYNWGTSKQVDKIFIRHGKTEWPVDLTASLKEALLRLRFPDKQRRLWADQICINQSDVAERSQQVQFMNRIYEHASHVLVWLGPDGSGLAKPAFDLVHSLDQLFQDEEELRKFTTAATEDLEEQSRHRWNALDHLTERPWFTRGWIVQEIGTKAPATLFWGDEDIDWTVLHRVCETLTDYHHLRSHFGIRTSEIKYAFERFVPPDMNSHHANRVNFVYELQRARGIEFTDPRDRVYAWLGHYSKHWTFKYLTETLKADYKKTLAEVYIDLAILALKVETDERNNDGSALIALAAVQHMSLSPSEAPAQTHVEGQIVGRDSLPSWVPDWRTYQGFILSEPVNPHYAHGTSSSKLSFDESYRVLRISGLQIDEIKTCSRALAKTEFHLKKPSGENKSTIEYIWHDVCERDHFDNNGQYLNGEDCYLFACMQTLSNGCVQIASREKMPYHEIPKSRWLEQEAMYLVKAFGQSDVVAPDLRQLAEEAKSKHVEEQWSRSANGASKNRIFAKTNKGYYVLGPKVMQPGDVVCVLFGGKVPFCLRPLGDHYLLVGECYVHGLMDGEAITMMKRQELHEEVFEIV